MTVGLHGRLRLLLLGILALLTACAPGATTAKPEKAAPVKLPQEGITGFQHIAPRLTVGGDHRVYLVWLSFTTGQPQFDSLFSRSDDDGLHWLERPISLQQNKARNSGSIQLLADPDGDLHAFYALGLRTPRREVFSLRSSDQGMSWKGPSLVKSANSLHASTYLLDAKGTPYAVIPVGWTEFDWKLEFFRSSDRGESWVQLPTLDYAMGKTVTGIRDFHIQAGDEGQLHAIWSEASTSSGLTVIYYNQLNTGNGGSWLPRPVQVNAEGVTFKGAQYPRISVGTRGRLFAVWEEFWKPKGRFEGSFPQKIFAVGSLDGGATWMTPTRLSPDGPKPQVSTGSVVASDGGDHAYVAWVEGDGNRPQHLKFAASADVGATWNTLAEPLYAAEPASYLATPLYLRADAEGRVYLLWQQVEGMSWKLLFNRSTDHGRTWFQKAYQIARTRQYSRAAHSLAFEVDGPHLFAAWDGGPGINSEIFATRSLDFGATWLERDVQVSRR